MQNLLIRILKTANRAFDNILLMLMLLSAALGTYFLWDVGNTYSQAQARVYRQYKPSVEKATSTFTELIEKNEDVKAWLTVKDTGIDYPVVQSKDNRYYLNRDVEDNYSTSGSIFIDSNCSSDFSDFNTIIYGHHMAHGAMFGDLDKFEEKEYFDEHIKGSIYFQGKELEIKFFAFIDSADGYDTNIYSYGINSTEEKRLYLDYLAEHAKYYRNTGVSSMNHIVLLSTCSQSMTNVRYILAGILGESSAALSEENGETVAQTWKEKILDFLLVVPIWIWIIIILLVILLIIVLKMISMKRRK